MAISGGAPLPGGKDPGRGALRACRPGLRPAPGTGPGDDLVHPTILGDFDRICRTRGAGGDVLEIGATASAARTREDHAQSVRTGSRPRWTARSRRTTSL